MDINSGRSRIDVHREYYMRSSSAGEWYSAAVIRNNSAFKDLQVVLDLVRITAEAVEELVFTHGLSTGRK